MTTVLPQFLVEAQKLIDTHNANADAHPAIHAEIDDPGCSGKSPGADV